jgi:hypothetical protein
VKTEYHAEEKETERKKIEFKIRWKVKRNNVNNLHEYKNI